MSLRRTLVPLACATLLLAGCSSPSAGTPPSASQAVLGVARRFLAEMRSGEYLAQWRLLSPTARSEWPSAATRAGMLRAKFPAGSVNGYRLGSPRDGGSWTSGESLRHEDHLWTVPVDLALSPADFQPPAAAGAYSHLALEVAVSRTGTAEVVGEGPASLDAPLLLPRHFAPREARVPILMYHVVAPYPQRSAFPSTYAYELELGLTVSPEEFAGQLAFLHGHGFHPISLARLEDDLVYGLPLPSRPVVLTFDDARLEPYTHAVPLLRRYRYTAAFFIPVHLVGWHNPTQSYMGWPQIDALAGEGFWIEDHSLTHITLWGLTPAELNLQALVSKAIIERHVGQPVQFLAYPGAWAYPTATQAGPAQLGMIAALRAMGYVAALTDPRTPSAVETNQQLLQMPRIRVDPNETLAVFASRMADT